MNPLFGLTFSSSPFRSKPAKKNHEVNFDWNSQKMDYFVGTVGNGMFHEKCSNLINSTSLFLRREP